VIICDSRLHFFIAMLSVFSHVLVVFRLFARVAVADKISTNQCSCHRCVTDARTSWNHWSFPDSSTELTAPEGCGIYVYVIDMRVSLTV